MPLFEDGAFVRGKERVRFFTCIETHIRRHSHVSMNLACGFSEANVCLREPAKTETEF